MTQYSGETGASLAAARAALAVGDRRLGEADRALADVLGEAHRLAVESIRRIETVQSEIDALDAGHEIDASSCAHLLLDRNRELIGIITAARDSAAAKVVELQRLSAASFSSR